MMDLYVHDPHKVLNNNDNLKVVSDFACGAWERKSPKVITKMNSFITNNKDARIVSTCLSDKAIKLRDFEFCDNDIILFGNEYDGLGDGVIASSHVQLSIAMPKTNIPKPKSINPIDEMRDFELSQNGVACLNVAVAAGIIGYEYYCWLERNGYYF